VKANAIFSLPSTTGASTAFFWASLPALATHCAAISVAR